MVILLSHGGKDSAFFRYSSEPILIRCRSKGEKGMSNIPSQRKKWSGEETWKNAKGDFKPLERVCISDVIGGQ